LIQKILPRFTSMSSRTHFLIIKRERILFEFVCTTLENRKTYATQKESNLISLYFTRSNIERNHKHDTVYLMHRNPSIDSLERRTKESSHSGKKNSWIARK
jgi:hypothetical protein